MAFEVDMRTLRSPAAIRGARQLADSCAPVLTRQRVEDLRLVLSELVTNAVRHGEGDELFVRLRMDGDVLRGEVVDEGGGFRPPQPSPPEVPGGAGLPIVEALVDRWGVEEGSTHVWFELRSDVGGP